MKNKTTKSTSGNLAFYLEKGKNVEANFTNDTMTFILNLNKIQVNTQNQTSSFFRLLNNVLKKT